MAEATDAKGGYDGHCEVVSHLSQLLAIAMDWHGRQLAQIRVAGLLHDVGKLSVPDAILLCPRALSVWEMALMREHSSRGHAFLLGLGLEEEARWVLHHHENFDGSGYPSRIGGEAIPIGARILHAADAFEAMIAARPYNEPKTATEAVAELERATPEQFCPQVVGALGRLVTTQGGGAALGLAVSSLGLAVPFTVDGNGED